MSKKGQVTLFIILGIILVILIGVIYAYREDVFAALGIGAELVYPSEVQEVVDWTQGCLEDTAQDAVTEVSLNAGNYETPQNAYTFESRVVPYAYYAGENTLLSSDRIEANIEDAFNAFVIESCYLLNPYVEDFNLSIQDGGVEATIESESVGFTVDFPMTASVGDSVYTLPTEYELSVLAKMGYVLDGANTIIGLSVADPNYFNYDAILATGLDVDILRMDDETYIFILRDATSFGGEAEYVFMFAGFYPIPEEEALDEELQEILEEEGLA